MLMIRTREGGFGLVFVNKFDTVVGCAGEET